VAVPMVTVLEMDRWETAG